MATSIIKLRTRLLILRAFYWKKSIYSCAFSSQSRSSSENKETKDIPKCAESTEDRWLNIKAGIFGPADKRLSLPGDIGINQDVTGQTIPKARNTYDLEQFLVQNNVKVISVKNVNVISHQNKKPTDFDLLVDNRGLELFVDSVEMERSSHLQKKQELLECRVQCCPKLLKRDFQELFPHINFQPDDVTILTICQKTENDMSGWSEKVEVEREQLIQAFVDMAEKLCNSLGAEGFWADFIDPSSGRPYLGPFTNSTMFETDDRYRHLGFRIEDLGCCKVITHKKWGANIFVGALFTNAPVNSSSLTDLLGKFNMILTYQS